MKFSRLSIVSNTCGALMPLIEHPPEEHPAYKQDQNVCKSHVAVPKSEDTNNFGQLRS